MIDFENEVNFLFQKTKGTHSKLPTTRKLTSLMKQAKHL